jgi:hypothetical protein
MATAKKTTEKETKTDVSVVEQTSTALAVSDDMFAADAGSGMEGATAESFAIPFISVLQKMSPQVDEADGAFVDGAKAGMFFENVTNTLTDGKTGVSVVPCAYRRVFLRWGPRGTPGAGFKGELAPEVVAQMRADGKIAELDGRLYVPAADGTVNPATSDRVADTRNHYVLLIDEKTGAWTQALLSLASTQIKKSKMLMSALASVKLTGPSGMYTPPTFANTVRVTSVPESNDKGTWHGVKFELTGRVARAEVYAAAKAFHASVAAGAVEVKYESPEASDAAASGTAF